MTKLSFNGLDSSAWTNVCTFVSGATKTRWDTIMLVLRMCSTTHLACVNILAVCEFTPIHTVEIATNLLVWFGLLAVFGGGPDLQN